ncbi:hypothetical protein CDIK_4238 [Cucumispora dikerogammari]|nr:hypothetical protein CDIK_4238 [Cucumispora dikerogammari]
MLLQKETYIVMKYCKKHNLSNKNIDYRGILSEKDLHKNTANILREFYFKAKLFLVSLKVKAVLNTLININSRFSENFKHNIKMKLGFQSHFIYVNKVLAELQINVFR